MLPCVSLSHHLNTETVLVIWFAARTRTFIDTDIYKLDINLSCEIKIGDGEFEYEMWPAQAGDMKGSGHSWSWVSAAWWKSMNEARLAQDPGWGWTRLHSDGTSQMVIKRQWREFWLVMTPCDSATKGSLHTPVFRSKWDFLCFDIKLL